MAAFAWVGLAVTSASAVIYGAPVVDPVELLGRLQSPPAICVALFGLILATLTTNIAANVVRVCAPPAARGWGVCWQ
jgi:NCS1 family nucleobase:cation symporter-1